MGYTPEIGDATRGISYYSVFILNCIDVLPALQPKLKTVFM
jgi:hypothetical protein